MSTEVKSRSVMVYTEQTPNPETLKFVTNHMLLHREIGDFPDEKVAKESPLALELFTFPFVKGVFITNNFVTVTKDTSTQWAAIIPELRAFIKDYVQQEKPVVTETFLKEAKEKRESEKAEDQDAGSVEQKIKEMLDKYVKPAVEMDGGAIQFSSFNDGVVSLILQGSCSGCPSSTITLKAGIEGMLKRMIPEVKEVIAEAG